MVNVGKKPKTQTNRNITTGGIRTRKKTIVGKKPKKQPNRNRNRKRTKTTAGKNPKININNLIKKYNLVERNIYGNPHLVSLNKNKKINIVVGSYNPKTQILDFPKHPPSYNNTPKPSVKTSANLIPRQGYLKQPTRKANCSSSSEPQSNSNSKSIPNPQISNRGCSIM